MTIIRMRRSRAQGFTLFELVIVISIIGILAAALVTRLDRTAEFAEKTSMEYTAATLNEALLLEFAHHIVDGSRREIPRMAQVNPMNLLARKPTNYLGEFRDSPAEPDQTGNWYYDLYAHELVYLVRRGDNFQADSTGSKRVRYKIGFELAEADSQTPVGVVLTPVEAYKWF